MEHKSEGASAPASKEVLVLVAPEKVKTIVVMDVPEGPLLCCQLEDLTLRPERGSSYVLDGRLFDVERAIEVIGIYKHGSHMSADEQLLSLLSMLSGADDTVVRVGNMRNIGKPDPSQTVGGIILSTTLNLTSGADRLVYLKLRLAQVRPSVDPMVSLARQVLAQNGSTKTNDDEGQPKG